MSSKPLPTQSLLELIDLFEQSGQPIARWRWTAASWRARVERFRAYLPDRQAVGTLGGLRRLFRELPSATRR
jgi:hypothetical protein